jgi:putative addiction module component (TIGR02574 family)
MRKAGNKGRIFSDFTNFLFANPIPNAKVKTMSVTAIQNEILGLPATERARLIDVLWDSISDAKLKARETAWAAESERRIDAFDAGKLTARDAAEVFADLKKDLVK